MWLIPFINNFVMYDWSIAKLVVILCYVTKVINLLEHMVVIYVIIPFVLYLFMLFIRYLPSYFWSLFSMGFGIVVVSVFTSWVLNRLFKPTQKHTSATDCEHTIGGFYSFLLNIKENRNMDERLWIHNSRML